MGADSFETLTCDIVLRLRDANDGNSTDLALFLAGTRSRQQWAAAIPAKLSLQRLQGAVWCVTPVPVAPAYRLTYTTTFTYFFIFIPCLQLREERHMYDAGFKRLAIRQGGEPQMTKVRDSPPCILGMEAL